MTTTPLSATVVIPGRFNGPANSANGGYACGLVASLIEDDVEVTLRSPPPLDVEMDVARVPGGVDVLDGNTLIATARHLTFEQPEMPAMPSWDEVVAASERYLGHTRHEFPTCFTCGPDRDDGLRIFPGPTHSGQVAAPWIPRASLPNHEGGVATPIVWAALDCPGAWVEARDLLEDPVVLGRMAAIVTRPIRIGQRYMAVAWGLGGEGRKSFAATALVDESGAVVATARQTWITVSSTRLS